MGGAEVACCVIYVTLLIRAHWIFTSVWYEPTCVNKAVKPIIAGVHPLLTWTSPNLSELRAMYGAVTGKRTHTNAELETTAGHRTFSNQIVEMINQILHATPQSFILCPSNV